MAKMKAIGILILAVAIVSASLMGMSCAPAPEKEYPAKNINWIIPNKTGGGFDAWSRAVGTRMPTYLPKKVDIVFENIPAAGGMEGTTKIYKSAPDGYIIGILNIPGYINNQLFVKVEYDLTKMSYIATVNADVYYLQVKKDSPFNSLKDLQAKGTLKFSTAGIGTTGWLVTVVGCKELGIEPEFVHFNAMRDAALALMRGDVDALFGAEGTTLPYMKSGDLKAVTAFLEERHPEFADVPTIGELGYPKLTTLIRGPIRIIAGPPDMPEGIAKILEEAILKTMEDSELIAWSKEAKRPIRGVANAAQSEETVFSGLETFAKYRDVLEEGIKK